LTPELFCLTEILNSKENFKQINEGNKVYYLINTPRNKFIGIKEDFTVKILNNFNYLEKSFWKKEEVDYNGFFRLTSLTAQKNLRVQSAKKFDLVDKGM
jgi:hypothetical protein